MAMCFATLGIAAAGIKLEDPSCVRKTVPSFFQILAKPPPALVFDALHAALLKHEGSSALKAALNLLLRRGLGKVNVIPGLKGPKFGAALP